MKITGHTGLVLRYQMKKRSNRVELKKYDRRIYTREKER